MFQITRRRVALAVAALLAVLVGGGVSSGWPHKQPPTPPPTAATKLHLDFHVDQGVVVATASPAVLITKRSGEEVQVNVDGTSESFLKLVLVRAYDERDLVLILPAMKPHKGHAQAVFWLLPGIYKLTDAGSACFGGFVVIKSGQQVQVPPLWGKTPDDHCYAIRTQMADSGS
ncbi:MAG TPA: hypothetical protein VMT30_03505 [Candidatus Saccharimonadia bacterium]|nr:hypothetical protein [Candidatus Saccharimonadia bacterium]